jgi:hypothetical protein
MPLSALVVDDDDIVITLEAGATINLSKYTTEHQMDSFIEL